SHDEGVGRSAEAPDVVGKGGLRLAQRSLSEKLTTMKLWEARGTTGAEDKGWIERNTECLTGRTAYLTARRLAPRSAAKRRPSLCSLAILILASTTSRESHQTSQSAGSSALRPAPHCTRYL